MKHLLLLTAFIFCNLLVNAQDSLTKIPELNQKMLDFVNKNKGKKVDRGECWDLVAKPLNDNGAKWDGEYKFGIKVDYKKDKIYPGDIIQFEKVLIKYKEGNAAYTINLEHHTAVVYEVLGKGHYKVAEQNTEKGKIVTIGDLNLNYMTKGKVQFFRPTK